MTINIDIKTCIECGCCIDVCAQGALELEDGHAVVDEETCINCLSCIGMCPVGAISQ